MNTILELKARFSQKGRQGGGPRTLNSGDKVSSSHLLKIREDLQRIYTYWEKDSFLDGALISVFYSRVIPKSLRLQKLLSSKERESNDSIVGAKFRKDGKDKKHVITHYITKEVINNSINYLNKCIHILDNDFKGTIDKETLDAVTTINSTELSKSDFINIIVDASSVEKFDVEDTPEDINRVSLVTIYKTNLTIRQLMEKLGINDYLGIGSVDETTLLLNPEQYGILKRKAPYLIAMALTDLRSFKFETVTQNYQKEKDFPEPSHEPTIGVIDSLFDTNVYFSKWVEYTDLVSNEIDKTPEDRDHGTMVSSIIVDGPWLNPDLDDGCGRFKVRHFGVLAGKAYSSFTVIRNIKDIVAKNPDIKVWNLSLGSPEEIDENFISPEAAVLDEIQYSYDVTFVIAGTNKTKRNQEKIGAPADSINGLVVNSVCKDGSPAPYSRKGPVLSFYTKPDVSYYGGVDGERMAVYSYDKLYRTGTSFAAPWIARKLAFLIQVMGLTREVAKALLIDSAAGWKQDISSSEMDVTGYGVVPQKITDILNTPDDEIRFLLTGIKEQYDTYNYNIPVPASNGKHPFIARATLCYYPKCFRNQGVDYTATEFTIQFGRMKDDGSIKPIDDNYQGEEGSFETEDSARLKYRKWDNVKHIGETLHERKIAKKAYQTKLWGISIKSMERLSEKYGRGQKFGIVITLKEINGKNRIQDFIQQCQMRGILVNPIVIKNQIDIYNHAQEYITLE